MSTKEHEAFLQHLADHILFVDLETHRSDIDRAVARVTAMVQTAVANAQMFKRSEDRIHVLQMFLYNWYEQHLHDREASKHDFTEMYDCNLLISILLLNHVSDPELYSWVNRLLASDRVQAYKNSRGGGKTWDDWMALHMALCERLVV